MSLDSRLEKNRSKILDTLLDQHTSIDTTDPLGSDMILNFGPQHPATHGVLRLLLRLDGERVVGCVPEIGYLHRGYEKLAENMTYYEYIPHTDRLDYLSPLANNVSYALAVEKLAGVEAPPRAQYIRTIVSELARISSHLMATGSMAMDVGALTILLWTFREREKLYDIFEVLTGARFTTSYSRIGGVAQDMTDEVVAMIREFNAYLPEAIEECERLLRKNRIFIERCDGIGTISAEDALAMGLTGPNLRGSGVARDLRRDNPYLLYNEIDFDIVTHEGGDCLSRYYVRIDEMLESLKIVTQLLDKMPKGEIHANKPKKVLPRKDRIYNRMEEMIHDFMLVNFGIDPPPGEIYFATENPKGELGWYICSRGGGVPWRLKIRSPSFVNIQAIPKMLKNAMISDVVAVIGSLDPVMGEADK